MLVYEDQPHIEAGFLSVAATFFLGVLTFLCAINCKDRVNKSSDHANFNQTSLWWQWLFFLPGVGDLIFHRSLLVVKQMKRLQVGLESRF